MNVRSALAAALGLVLGLAPAGARADASLDPPGWVAPTRARVAPFSLDTPTQGGAVEVDPSVPISLAKGLVLLLPIEPGDRVRLDGPITAVGLGTGVRDVPDAVTWLPLSTLGGSAPTSGAAPPNPPPTAAPTSARTTESRVVDVPMWTGARFLVVRSDKPATITASMGSLLRSSLAWHRLDEDVTRWLRDPASPRPETTIPEAASILRWIFAAKSALDAAPPDATRDWLTVRWLESSLLVRPLVEPYFVRRPVVLEGGRDAREAADHLTAEPDASPWRLVLASRGALAAKANSIVVDAPASDVVRLSIQARGIGAARAIVRAGDLVVRELVWDVATRTADAQRWTATQSIRIPLLVDTRRVSIEALEGEIAVAATAFRKRTDVLDIAPRARDREARLDALGEGAKEPAAAAVLRLAAAADRTGAAHDVDAVLKRVQASDVPPAFRAFLLAEAVRWATSPEQAREAAERAFDLARALPAGAAGPALRAVLERLTAAHARTLPPPRPWERPLPEATHEDDRAALDALRAILSPPEDGRRPAAAPLAERYAWLHGDLPSAANRARQTWVREAPWDTLDPPSGAVVWNDISVPFDNVGSTRCALVGPRGLRWTVLREGRAEIDVLPPPAPATHTRLLVISGQTDPAPETSLLIDNIAAAVHTGAGLGTGVAVTPGRHAFERPAGAVPVFARIPRDGAAPCDTLRELTRWIRLNGDAKFRVPDPGRATVARVVAHVAESGTRKPRRLHVRVGDRVYEAWIDHGATGAIEVPVPADAGEIQVETQEETLLRVSARLHPQRAPEPRIPAAARETAPEAIALLLARVRDASRELEKAPPAAQDALRKRRAEALESLGYGTLAALDRKGDIPLETAEEPDTQAPPQALLLPAGSPAVVPLGLLPRIPPLPLPKELDPLTRARRAQAADDTAAALTALTDGNARASTDADGLMYAVLTERTGAGWIASEVFERIGLTHRSGPALARAAALSTDRAADEQDRARALRSFILAQHAVENGDPASHAFARLAPAVGWLAVARADNAAGTGLVDVRGGRTPSLGVQVRRALLDVPDDALLLAEGQHVELRVRQSKPTTLGVETQCLALEDDPLCQLSVEIDGKPAPCGDAPASPRTACTLSIPRGPHRVEIRAPRGRTIIGSARLSGAGGFSFQARVVSEWFEIDPDRPLELAFAAPTVVRLEARGPAGEPRTLGWSLDPQIPLPGTTSRGELLLDPTADPAAHLVGGDRNTLVPLGQQLEKRIPVLPDGPHTLHVTSPGGRALVRVQLAVPIGLPKPRRAPPVPGLRPAPTGAPEPPLRVAPDIVSDADPGSLLTSVYARLVDLDVGDEDNLTGARLLEVGVALRREIETIHAWTQGSVFARARFGAPSFGVAGSFDLAPNGFIPGLFVRGRVVAQPVDTFGLGARALAGVLWSIPLADSVSLVPWGGAALVLTDPNLAGQDDADREVWTRYSSTHPAYGVVGLRALFRPAIDALASVGLSTRTTPDFAGIDRADLEAQLHLLPGRGFTPWITLGAFTSYRPAGYDRPESFLRSGVNAQLTFWTWLMRGHRLSAGAEGRVLLDVPRETSPFRLSGGIFVAYDLAGGRGLRDLPPREAPFRARLEEGSGRIDRRRTSSDPTWGTPP
ncbi:hypothetical protein [Polyangium mundeleinium]|uniref:Uncharacterized protein n=1 Tax=Polyangium mundeleinium TaxID=2995306 RepID=A0ABT5F281_9BACT|nr:hypothetical protein [Polyangium mundeleinium]MDC0748205.1 hypothetical protein [Polyangium mundeleinium]